MSATITGFPRSNSERYLAYTADPIQNMLAPYIKVLQINIGGLPIEIEYVTLADAYNLLKRAAGDPVAPKGE